MAVDGECKSDAKNCSDLGCKICTENNTTCVVCRAGYTNHQGKCYENLLENCMLAEFGNQNVCTKCRFGYYDKDGKCIKSSLWEDEEQFLSAGVLGVKVMIVGFMLFWRS